MQALPNVLFVLLSLASSARGGQDQAVTPDLGLLATGQGWQLFHVTPAAAAVDGKRAVRLQAQGDSANGIVGLALADKVEFTTGSITVDLKGKNLRGRSFLGVAFNVADAKTFEAVYFRPFNFQAEGVFQGRAVQYIAWPAYTWEKLRSTRTGQFEAAVRPVPNPDQWFHARIDVGEKQVRVYVNDAKEPCLTVDRLAAGVKGRGVGFFVDSADGLYANLKIIPAK